MACPSLELLVVYIVTSPQYSRRAGALSPVAPPQNQKYSKRSTACSTLLYVAAYGSIVVTTDFGLLGAFKGHYLFRVHDPKIGSESFRKASRSVNKIFGCCNKKGEES